MIIIDHARNEVFFVQKTFTVHLVGDPLLHTFAPDAEIKGGGGGCWISQGALCNIRTCPLLYLL